MIRSILSPTFCLVMAMCCSAQTDSSLTQDFGKRSAKERTRIALREQEESLRDNAFQDLMASAEKLFQEKRYDEALAKFKEARMARPYNVHPKVKIHDLEIYIRERDKAANKSLSKVEEPEEKFTEHMRMPAIDVKTDSLKSSPAISPRPTTIGTTMRSEENVSVLREKGIQDPVTYAIDKVDRPETISSRGSSVVQPVGIEKVPSTQERALEYRPELSPGERIYKEAGAVVIERIIEEEGRLVIYRKVTRQWGGSIHFREGVAITIHAWEDVFGGH